MAGHITIGDVSPRIQYTADGAQTVFIYPFPIFKNADMDVYLDDTLQGAGFAIAGAGQSGGGTVTFDTAPANGVVVTLHRNMTIERTSDFQQSGEFRAKVINDELDYLVAVDQQLSEEVSRTLRVTPTATANADLTVPNPVAGALLGFDEDGDAFKVYDAASFKGDKGDKGDTGASGDMSGANNLSELTDTAAARTTLDVYSKGEVDASDQVARDLAIAAYIKADIATNDPAGVYGDIISDNFTSDTLATKTNATYGAAGDFYSNEGAPTTYGADETTTGNTIYGTQQNHYPATNCFDNSTGTTMFNLSSSANSSNCWVGQDFGFGVTKNIRRVTYQSNSHGGSVSTWSFPEHVVEYSDDGTVWTALDTITTPADTTKRTFDLPDGGAHRYWRFRATTLNASGTWYGKFGDIEMMEATAYGSATNMTLRPSATTLPTANPLDLSMYFRVNDVGTVVNGTDRVIKASVDGGTTWATATITEIGSYGGSEKLIRADADVSGQSGSSFVWELTTFNSKKQQIKQVAAVSIY